MATTYDFISNRNSRNISPLYIFTKNAIDREVNQLYLTKAYNAVQMAIDTCCFPRHKTSKNPFLNTFYVLLNGMERKLNLNKITAVRDILNNKLACCFPDLS